VLLNSTLGCCSGCHGNIAGVKQVFHRNCLVFGPEINWLPWQFLTLTLPWIHLHQSCSFIPRRYHRNHYKTLVCYFKASKKEPHAILTVFMIFIKPLMCSNSRGCLSCSTVNVQWSCTLWHSGNSTLCSPTCD